MRYFHYKWENENGLLGPLFSIAEPFDVPYVWTFDTRAYPWTLNLKEPTSTPTCEVRFGKNLAEIEREIDPSNIVNRLYPLGYGEGDNQLGITRVNNGVPYIENTASIIEYGLGQYVWVDRRFEDAESLLASAKSFLDEWSIPKVTYRIKAVDLSSLTGISADKFTAGKVIRVIDPDIGAFEARIVSESKSDIYGAPYDVNLEIMNTRSNIGTTLADIERRQEINEVYSQGATNMLIYPYEDNADESNPAVIRFNLPEEMVRINKLELTYETSEFRSYGATTSGGGGTTATSSSGGGVAKSTASGGGSTQTSGGGGDHTHVMFQTTGTTGQSGEHVAATTRGGVGIVLGPGTPTMQNFETLSASGSHTHSVPIPSHTHDFDIPNHTHSVTIPNHTHGIEHGIFKLSRMPSKITIKVDGNTVPRTALTGESIDLIPYLALDSERRVQRGWHTVEIKPNDLGRINAQLMTQFFMQSRGGVDV